jgi:hypothetical protein
MTLCSKCGDEIVPGFGCRCTFLAVPKGEQLLSQPVRRPRTINRTREFGYHEVHDEGVDTC